MRLVFAGTPDVALPSLRALLESRHEVAAVVTRPDAPAGRGRRLTPSPVAEVAAEHGLETLKPTKVGDPEFLDRLRAIGPDCCPVVARGFDQHGEPVVIEGSELLARALQHETDHLDGILFVDRLTPELRKVAMKEIRESEWFGTAGSPQIRVSPHATGGLGL